MKKTSAKILVFIAIVITSSNCFGQNNIDSLIENLEHYIQKKYIPGAMISIVRADTTMFVGGIGYADIENKEKVNSQHLFRHGSISKSFTALGLLKLLKESSFDLNSPIKEIDKNIPFLNKWEDTNPVRVVHLLEHTSGFDDFHLHAIYNTKDSTLPPVKNMLYDHRQSLCSRWKPGTKKAYSNPNYIVIGHLIEVLSESSFDAYINENVLRAMNMASSGFYFKKPSKKPFAKGYQRTGTQINPISFATINGSPAGDFCANSKDMALYLQFMLNRDTTLFTGQEYNRIESTHTSLAAKMGLRSGYGLGNYTIWKNGYLFHGHGGEIEGFAARYMYSREADIGIAVAINRNGNVNEIVDEILDYLIGIHDHPPAGRICYPIPESLQNKYAGFYEIKSPRNELLSFSERMFGGFILDFKDDMLVRRRVFGRPKDTLYYAGDNQFYMGNEGLPSAMILESLTDKPAFWINDNYTEKESRSRRIFIFLGLLISFLFLASFFIYSLIWLIRNINSSKKKDAFNHLALFGFGLLFIFMFTGFAFTMGNIQSAMTMNFSSLLMYLSSYALIPLALISAYGCFKLPKKKGFKAFYILTSIGAIAITIYLWDIGFIGLKLWNY